jgi:hypothetical protein
MYLGQGKNKVFHPNQLMAFTRMGTPGGMLWSITQRKTLRPPPSTNATAPKLSPTPTKRCLVRVKRVDCVTKTSILTEKLKNHE